MKSLPKYVEKALKDRTKYMAKVRNAQSLIDKYATKIGIKIGSQEFDDACLCSDVRIYCEVDCCENSTRKVLLDVLNGVNNNA